MSKAASSKQASKALAKVGMTKPPAGGKSAPAVKGGSTQPGNRNGKRQHYNLATRSR